MATSGTNRLRQMSAEVRELEEKLRQAGGPKKLQKLHEQGKLSARERVELLRDVDSSMLEVGLLVAYDQYEGQAPSAGVVTSVIRVHGREVVVVANDATVKAGSWWPETIKKMKSLGAEVSVEAGAGLKSGILDADYEAADG